MGEIKSSFTPSRVPASLVWSPGLGAVSPGGLAERCSSGPAALQPRLSPALARHLVWAAAARPSSPFRGAQGSAPPCGGPGAPRGPGLAAAPSLWRRARPGRVRPPPAPEAATPSGVAGGAMAADTQVSAGRACGTGPRRGGGPRAAHPALRPLPLSCAPPVRLRSLARRPRSGGDVAAGPGREGRAGAAHWIQPQRGRAGAELRPAGERSGVPLPSSVRRGGGRGAPSGCRGRRRPGEERGTAAAALGRVPPAPEAGPDKPLAGALSLPAQVCGRPLARHRARRARGAPPGSQCLSGGYGHPRRVRTFGKGEPGRWPRARLLGGVTAPECPACPGSPVTPSWAFFSSWCITLGCSQGESQDLVRIRSLLVQTLRLFSVRVCSSVAGIRAL